MGLPNLFILGAGKSGTTTLYDILKRHPEIAVSPIKEPSFFCSPFQVVTNPIEYFRLFDGSARYRVEASHVYFSNPETAPVLRELFPAAKFLVILRHPKARARSLYQHMRRAILADGRPIEEAESFHEALTLEAERFHDPEFSRHCRHYFWNQMYLRSSCYDEQLARYFALYPRDRFLILTLAELHKQPQSVLDWMAGFLGLDSAGFGTEIPVSNAAPPYDPSDAASDVLMEAFFGDLTGRVDRLTGQRLDWSL